MGPEGAHFATELHSRTDQRQVADRYYFGKGVAKSAAKANKWWAKAATQAAVGAGRRRSRCRAAGRRTGP